MIQSGIMITVIDALILLWCVRQMRMVQSGIMIAVIHTLLDITVMCTLNAYGIAVIDA